MKIACAQLNSTVGDFTGNLAKLTAAYQRAVNLGADLVIAPELFLCGYPPRDLLTYADFLDAHDAALETLDSQVGEVPLVVGCLSRNRNRPGRPLFNSAVVLQKGTQPQFVHKSLLPTYDVFDEDRYFEPASGCHPVVIAGKRVALTICEDIWNDEDFWPERLYRKDPVRELADQGIDLILNLSASPWHLKKEGVRAALLAEAAKTHQVPAVQVNAIGGNDELVFDGQSLAVDAQGRLLAVGNSFEEDLFLIDPYEAAPLKDHQWPVDEAQLFYALSRGTADYVGKCGFKQAVIGLSGGIDSAITAAIAVDALGPENVLGVLMPSQYSSEGSIQDAQALAQSLEIDTHLVPIQPVFEAALGQLDPIFAGAPSDITEENMQARIRGLYLMAISNKQNRILLTTGNKSELAVGYCTLYGDMCGGLAVINDMAKTQIYRLARWINRKQEIIPNHTIEKPPSAELRPDQTDQDSLPDYDTLDAILNAYIIENLSAEQIAARGYSLDLVREILRKIDFNEYKRRQAVPGLKVTSKAFGLGRRMPIAQRYKR